MTSTAGMKRPKDQVRAAYYDQLGVAFGKKVRARIHWIVREAKGEDILDVGCSGGLVPILLGREGKRVTGIDVSPEAIAEATSALKEEAASVQSVVMFSETNIMSFSANRQFDTVLMTEVLEHIGEPERVIQQAYTLVKPGGRLVVTVPFGVNDYADHKRTYYLKRLVEQVTPYGTIEKIERFDKWLGVTLVVQEDVQPARMLSAEEVDWLEDSFETVERMHLAEVIRLKQVNKRLEQKVQHVAEIELRMVEQSNEQVKLEHQVSEMNQQLEQLAHQYTLVLKRYEEALVSNMEVLEANEAWKSKYRSLANSKLGKVIVRYWKLRRKLSRRQARRR
ncbi:bifunctional 2-polyprenyl-6-hydroxyphenol methylase/3-demethylubiquinol 3-O-methyltransferase UbiG [Exiguobacterium sp. S90]|uniref:class I SAM-dependent methyltransferase n=1 Tax=Exiguobacterium sp. S90 TaxID=1221231 RepID=UPI001BE98DC1|nr:methyltransferase domain-containing protein [Exiguobacterium sp. S90]